MNSAFSKNPFAQPSNPFQPSSWSTPTPSKESMPLDAKAIMTEVADLKNIVSSLEARLGATATIANNSGDVRCSDLLGIIASQQQLLLQQQSVIAGYQSGSAKVEEMYRTMMSLSLRVDSIEANGMAHASPFASIQPKAAFPNATLSEHRSASGLGTAVPAANAPKPALSTEQLLNSLRFPAATAITGFTAASEPKPNGFGWVATSAPKPAPTTGTAFPPPRDTVDGASRYGLTPLHYASLDGHAATIESLITKGGDVKAVTVDGVTPLHYAALHTHAASIELLITKGSDVKAHAEDGETPLHLAAKYGHAAAIELLIAKGGDVAAVSKDGHTPLHCAAMNGHASVIESLIAKGGDVKAVTKDGDTPKALYKKRPRTASNRDMTRRIVALLS